MISLCDASSAVPSSRSLAENGVSGTRVGAGVRQGTAGPPGCGRTWRKSDIDKWAKAEWWKVSVAEAGIG